jgi:hypothetical protein
MVKITNDINQTINFVDDRADKTGSVNLQLTHIATGKVETFENNTVTDGAFVIDASNLRNGLHKAEIANITSFIVKVFDVNSLSLSSPNKDIVLGYKNNL